MKKCLRILALPAQCLDLNPVENLWAKVKKSIQKLKSKLTNLEPLRRYMQDAWTAIPKNMLENLIDHMLRRIQAMIMAKAGPIKYWLLNRNFTD